MASLKAIQNHIIFQFLDGFTNRGGISQFASKTDWGFEVAKTEESLEEARWGTVISVGKDVPEDIQPGMQICIDKLKWTNAFQFEGEDYWRTDSDQVLLVNEGDEIAAWEDDETNEHVVKHIRNVWK